MYDEKYEAWLKLHHPEAVNVKSKNCTHIDPVTPRTLWPRSATHLPSPSISTHVSPDQPSTSGTSTTTPKAPSSKSQKACSTSSTAAQESFISYYSFHISLSDPKNTIISYNSKSTFHVSYSDPKKQLYQLQLQKYAP